MTQPLKRISHYLRVGDPNLTDEEIILGLAKIQEAVDILSALGGNDYTVRALRQDWFRLDDIRFQRAHK